jgi:hypothetical protein
MRRDTDTVTRRNLAADTAPRDKMQDSGATPPTPLNAPQASFSAAVNAPETSEYVSTTQYVACIASASIGSMACASVMW